MAVSQKGDVTVLKNNFVIYADPTGQQPLIEMARPQDWGDPDKYVYREFIFEALVAGQRYRHKLHCWTDEKGLDEWQYPSFFGILVGQLLMPGTPAELVGRKYLAEDDLWNDEWGPRPPYADEDIGFSEN